MFDRIERTVSRLSTTSALVGGMGLLFATVLTCISIILKLIRRGLDAVFGPTNIPETLLWVRPILGEEELVQWGVGFALFAALPYVMFQRGHIKVDLFEPFFGTLGNRILAFAGDVLFAVIAYLILTRQWFLMFKKARGDDPKWIELFFTGDWSEIADRLRDNQESQVLGLKLWPGYLIAEICVAIFFVVALFCVWRSARTLVQGRAV